MNCSNVQQEAKNRNILLTCVYRIFTIFVESVAGCNTLLTLFYLLLLPGLIIALVSNTSIL